MRSSVTPSQSKRLLLLGFSSWGYLATLRDGTEKLQFLLVVRVYKRMRLVGAEHDSYTLPLLNQAVLMLGSDAILHGKMIHCVGIEMGFRSDVYFCNTLIEVYVNNGATGFAHMVFEEMPHRDLVSWTSMISGFVSVGDKFGPFQMFNEMRIELEPNSVTMITMLQASCSCVGSVEQGQQFHGYLLKKGFLSDGSVRNSLLHMYANKCKVEDVENLYSETNRTDVIALNILLSCYNSVGDTEGVIKKFSEMQAEVSPSKETLSLVAPSISKYPTVLQGQQLHCYAVKRGFCDNVLWTCLLTLYAERGYLGASIKLFEEIPHKSSITWSSLMSAYVQHGYPEKAVVLFNQIQATRIKPGLDIITTLVGTCADLGALQMGKKVHGYSIRNLAYIYTESSNAAIFETSILNMYIRCGHISSARNCFGMMIGSRRDIIAWTSMIDGYGTYGLGVEAIRLFKQMLEEGIKPNGITFLSLLSACSHAGLTKEGLHLLHSMRSRYGIEPDALHYTCVVDLLGRSGELQQALALCLKMLACPDSRTWGALLAASRIFENRRIGEFAAEKLLGLEPDNIGYHIVLSNIQARAELWADVEALRDVASDVDIKKMPGWSCIEVGRGIEGFVSRDRTHPRTEEVYEVLQFLTTQMQG
ncbi:hypothetical protein Dimus_002146 [Dionaea muscipula]